MRTPKLMHRFWHGASIPATYTEHSDLFEYSSDFWGSHEEFEVQTLLQQIVTSSLDSQHCTEVLISLREKLKISSSGWNDRFVVSQGIVVLHKLLADINTENREYQGSYDRELVIVECFSMLYRKSTVAQQLVNEDPTGKIMKTLLRSLLSPKEETRRLVSETVAGLKATPGSPSRVLHTLTLTRYVPT